MRFTKTNIAERQPASGREEGNKDRNILVPVHADTIKKQNKVNKESRKPIPPPAG